MVALSLEFKSRPVLISSSDQFVVAAARHSDELARHYTLSPGIALQALLCDKKTQYELAAAHAMPMPMTSCAESPEDVLRFGAGARFPALMKPLHFREWRRLPTDHSLFSAKIAIADSRDELVRQYSSVAKVTPTVILQEIIDGPDTAKRVYLSCYDSGSRRIANAMFRELRCDPLGFGPATMSEPVDDDETDDVCNRFLRSIGYIGVCEIEMKRDSRDGRIKLIEANPRLSGGGDAAPYVGVDLCWLHYLDLIGQTPSPVHPAHGKVRHVVLRSDGAAIPAYLSAGTLNWMDVVRSYRPPLAFYDLDRRDLKYSAETILVFLRSMARGLIQGRRRPGTPR